MQNSFQNTSSGGLSTPLSIKPYCCVFFFTENNSELSILVVYSMPLVSNDENLLSLAVFSDTGIYPRFMSVIYSLSLNFARVTAFYFLQQPL